MAVLLDRWADIDGYAAGHNLPELETMSQDRLDNFVWWFLTKDADDQTELDKFKARLWQPPRGVAVTDPRSPWSPEREAGAFASLKASLGATGKAPGPQKKENPTDGTVQQALRPNSRVLEQRQRRQPVQRGSGQPRQIGRRR